MGRRFRHSQEPGAGPYGEGQRDRRRVLLPRSQEGEREANRISAANTLRLKDWGSHFTVDDFGLPLNRDRVTSVCPKEGGENPGLDFTVGTEDHPAALTVRLSFLEHRRDD